MIHDDVDGPGSEILWSFVKLHIYSCEIFNLSRDFEETKLLAHAPFSSTFG